MENIVKVWTGKRNENFKKYEFDRDIKKIKLKTKTHADARAQAHRRWKEQDKKERRKTEKWYAHTKCSNREKNYKRNI